MYAQVGQWATFIPQARVNQQIRVYSRRSTPWWQWHRGRQGPGAHGRELFSPVLVVAPDRDPIRVLPLRSRSRSYFVHVHLSRRDSARRAVAVRRGRNNLPGRQMRLGDERHRDTGSLGARVWSSRRALDQRDAEIPWVYHLRRTLSRCYYLFNNETSRKSTCEYCKFYTWSRNCNSGHFM